MYWRTNHRDYYSFLNPVVLRERVNSSEILITTNKILITYFHNYFSNFNKKTKKNFPFANIIREN